MNAPANIASAEAAEAALAAERKRAARIRRSELTATGLFVSSPGECAR